MATLQGTVRPQILKAVAIGPNVPAIIGKEDHQTLTGES
jgi:hypothetical protein